MVGLPIPGMSHYIASKMGIIGFMRGLANDVAADGITANAVLPGLRHITLAWGRDYGDVSPLRGVVLGGGDHELTVGVSVVPADEPTPSAPAA